MRTDGARRAEVVHPAMCAVGPATRARARTRMRPAGSETPQVTEERRLPVSSAAARAQCRRPASNKALRPVPGSVCAVAAAGAAPIPGSGVGARGPRRTCGRLRRRPRWRCWTPSSPPSTTRCCATACSSTSTSVPLHPLPPTLRSVRHPAARMPRAVPCPSRPAVSRPWTSGPWRGPEIYAGHRAGCGGCGWPAPPHPVEPGAFIRRGLPRRRQSDRAAKPVRKDHQASRGCRAPRRRRLVCPAPPPPFQLLAVAAPLRFARTGRLRAARAARGAPCARETPRGARRLVHRGMPAGGAALRRGGAGGGVPQPVQSGRGGRGAGEQEWEWGGSRGTQTDGQRNMDR